MAMFTPPCGLRQQLPLGTGQQSTLLPSGGVNMATLVALLCDVITITLMIWVSNHLMTFQRVSPCKTLVAKVAMIRFLMMNHFHVTDQALTRIENVWAIIALEPIFNILHRRAVLVNMAKNFQPQVNFFYVLFKLNHIPEHCHAILA